MTKKSCETCEFNFGVICAGSGRRTDDGEITYGSSIYEMIKMFPNGCEDWGVSLDAFIENEKK